MWDKNTLRAVVMIPPGGNIKLVIFGERDLWVRVLLGELRVPAYDIPNGGKIIETSGEGGKDWDALGES